MVTVNEAKEKIIANTSLLPIEKRSTEASAGYVLAGDILSPMPLPSFRQSSMDGYAIIHSDVTGKGISLKIADEAKAGLTITQTLTVGNAIRIFTGAPVPDGATAVIMQENTVVENGHVVINEYPVAEGKNVRNIGQQVEKGGIGLVKGTFLTPGSVGFLLGMNVPEVEVYRKPKIGLLVTGDELLKQDEPLSHGKIYESNSAMLISALSQEGISGVDVLYAKDNLESTKAALAELAVKNDIVLATGGVSVGDYDFVGKALSGIQAETVFYKVRQKPGKPLLFAKTPKNSFLPCQGIRHPHLCVIMNMYSRLSESFTGDLIIFLRALKMPV